MYFIYITDGELNRDFRKAKHDGLPYGIVWVVEYFTLDGGGFRWGRLYQQAGFFTHCLLWYINLSSIST